MSNEQQSPERSCGACKLWKQCADNDGYSKDIGECLFGPLPWAASELSLTFRDNGEECQTFIARGNP